jgi:5-methylcytosine-specific restriction protein B
MINSILENFLVQASTDDIRTKGYPNEYKDCQLKISFGKGRVSTVPWIAFLRGNNEIRRGIYPAILYYKKHDLLIVSFAIGSYLNSENTKWKFPNNIQFITIKDSLKNIQSSNLHYGNSFVYKIFHLKEEINFESIQKSLDFIIDIYIKHNE